MSFKEIAESIENWVSDGAVHGAAIAVEYRGDVVATHVAGEAQPGVAVNESTLFGLASVSKPFTAAGFMCLVDDGLVELDQPVTDVLPDFGAEVDHLKANALLESRRDEITFRQLLAHTSGLPVNPSNVRVDQLPTTEEQIDLMLQDALIDAPGTVLRYGNIGPAIAARAMDVLTGDSYLEVIQHRVLDPMGLTNIILTPGSHYDDRIATLQDPADKGTPHESYNSRWWRENGIPWGGYYGTPGDALRFATSFLPGRESVLSESSKRAMTTDQVNGLNGGVDSMYTVWEPGFWSVGWEVKGTKPRHWTGSKTSAATYDHWGFAGTLVWVDPTRELGVAVFANRSVATPWAFRPARWNTLSDALCEEADTQ